jgi:hypothetical protein
MEQVIPVGVDAVKVIWLENLFCELTVTVEVPEDPATITTLDVAAEMVKSGSGTVT